MLVRIGFSGILYDYSKKEPRIGFSGILYDYSKKEPRFGFRGFWFADYSPQTKNPKPERGPKP